MLQTAEYAGYRFTEGDPGDTERGVPKRETAVGECANAQKRIAARIPPR